MKTVENQTFQATRVDVDDTRFEKCMFDGVTLSYSGGSLPRFVDCQFRNIKLEFTGAADNTLQFLIGLRKGGFAPAVDKILKSVRQSG